MLIHIVTLLDTIRHYWKPLGLLYEGEAMAILKKKPHQDHQKSGKYVLRGTISQRNSRRRISGFPRRTGLHRTVCMEGQSTPPFRVEDQVDPDVGEKFRMRVLGADLRVNPPRVRVAFEPDHLDFFP